MENNSTNLNSHHLSLEFDKVLAHLSKYAISSLGKNACLNIEILDNKTKIEYELNLVDEAKKIIDNTQQYLPINELIDIDEVMKNTRFLAVEIVELAKNLRYARLVKNYISKNEAYNLNEIIKNLYVDKDFEDSVFDIFDSELNLLDSASDTLRSLRNSYKDNKDNLKNAINNLLSNHSFVENLQDTVISLRENRPVFQVKAS